MDSKQQRKRTRPQLRVNENEMKYLKAMKEVYRADSLSHALRLAITDAAMMILPIEKQQQLGLATKEG